MQVHRSITPTGTQVSDAMSVLLVLMTLDVAVEAAPEEAAVVMKLVVVAVTGVMAVAAVRRGKRTLTMLMSLIQIGISHRMNGIGSAPYDRTFSKCVEILLDADAMVKALVAETTLANVTQAVQPQRLRMIRLLKMQQTRTITNLLCRR